MAQRIIDYEDRSFLSLVWVYQISILIHVSSTPLSQAGIQTKYPIWMWLVLTVAFTYWSQYDANQCQKNCWFHLNCHANSTTKDVAILANGSKAYSCTFLLLHWTHERHNEVPKFRLTTQPAWDYSPFQNELWWESTAELIYSRDQ